MSMRVVWCLCAFSDVNAFRMMSMRVFWCLCAFSGVYAFRMMSMCVFWCLCAFSGGSVVILGLLPFDPRDANDGGFMYGSGLSRC